MKAMILAAGLGTRLRPLTNDRPKALVELNGTSLLEHNLKRLASFGIQEFFINVHHFADKVEDYLKSNDNFGLKINISDERDMLLETGGGLKKVFHEHKLSEPLLVYNTDIITDLDIGQFIEQHLNSGADASLSVKNRKSSRYLLFDSSMQLGGWKHEEKDIFRWRKEELNNYKKLAFSGIHIIGPKFSDKFQKEDKFSVIETYLNNNDLNINGIEHHSVRFIDAGKHETLQAAGELMKQTKTR